MTFAHLLNIAANFKLYKGNPPLWIHHHAQNRFHLNANRFHLIKLLKNEPSSDVNSISIHHSTLLQVLNDAYSNEIHGVGQVQK